MARYISTRARRYVRRMANYSFEAVVRIERGADESITYERSNLVAYSGSRETIYEGPARIWTVNTGGSYGLGEETITTEQTRVSIPWDVPQVPRIDDEFEILSHETDAALIGRRGHITSTTSAGDLRPTRSFNVSFTENRGHHAGDDD